MNEPVSNIELKTCPFCGHIPELELFNDGFFDYARIQCCRLIFDCCGDKIGDKVTTAWNTRAQPSNEPLTCDGCEHRGLYENEVEYGYSSPCTICKRRCMDNYRHKPEQEVAK